jgi:methyl-accepting chemotaxis protein
MKHLKIATKMGLVIAVLAATALVIAIVGYLRLGEVNERLGQLVDQTARAAELCSELRFEVLNVVRAERGAIVADKDEVTLEYRRSAESAMARANTALERLTPLLESSPSVERRQQLNDFVKYWNELQGHQKEMLELSAIHSNTKADALLNNELFKKTSTLITQLERQLAMVDKGAADAPKDAAHQVATDKKVRALLRAMALLPEYSRLLNRHIYIRPGAEMDRVELQTNAVLTELDTLLTGSQSPLDDKLRRMAETALVDLATLGKQVQDLSRIDSNYRSTQLALGPARKAFEACIDALGKLYAGLNGEMKTEMARGQAGAVFAQRLMLIVPAVGIPLSLVLAILLTRAITRPVAHGVAVSGAIARGDLTQRLNLEQRDEIGQLTQALDRAAATFSRIVGDIRRVSAAVGGSASELSGVSHQLLAQSEEMATQASHVAGSTGQMETNINTMAAAAEQMSMNVVSISSASEEISVNVGTISSAAEGAARNVGTVSDAIRNATRTFETVSADARANSQVASQAMELAQHATGTMNLLDRAAGEINKVTETIKMIALQTNLLALNATIEATSAGEAGKGFAVVAHEIKELANQSGKAAEDIARRIEGVQESKRDVVRAIQAVSEIIQTINTSAGRISEAVEKQMRGAMASAANLDEASKGVGNIAGSIAEVSKGANDMSRNAAEAATGANDVSRNAADAARGVREISSNIQGVSQATRDNTASAQRVNAAAEKLSDIAAELQKIVGQFKIQE